MGYSPQIQSTSGYSYFGEGLESGQCGIIIDAVKKSHNGKMECFMGLVTGHEINGSIPIMLTSKILMNFIFSDNILIKITIFFQWHQWHLKLI